MSRDIRRGTRALQSLVTSLYIMPTLVGLGLVLTLLGTHRFDMGFVWIAGGAAGVRRLHHQHDQWRTRFRRG